MNIVAVAVADYVGFILILAMMISSRIRRKDGGLELKIFSVIAFLSATSCVIDFFVFFFDGRGGPFFKAFNIFGNTYCFIANPIFVFAWVLYEDLKLYHSESRIIRVYKYAAIPAVLLVLAALVNIFVPFIFVMDEQNRYHRLPFNYVFYIVETGYLIYSVILLKNYQKKYGKVRFFPLYLMLGPIALGCLLQAMFYGVSLIWVSLAVGLTAIFMSLQNEFSYMDTLTGLYNRAYLDYQMEISSKNPATKMGGIMIDVDYFKEINDTFGHSVGDEALTDVARIILMAKPEEAIAIRFAGDEFILIVKETSEYLLEQIVEGIRDVVRIFNEHEGKQYKISLSMGYSMYDYEKDNMDSFFKKIDDNMYTAKKKSHEEAKKNK